MASTLSLISLEDSVLYLSIFYVCEQTEASRDGVSHLPLAGNTGKAILVWGLWLGCSLWVEEVKDKRWSNNVGVALLAKGS